MADNNVSFKPGPFQGQSGDNVIDWLDQFQQYAEFANWDGHRRYRALRNMLQGKCSPMAAAN